MPFSFDFGGFDPSAFGGFSGGDASQPQRPKRERKPRKAIGNAFTRTLINLGVTLLFGLGYFYFELPALNFHAEEFYVFVFLLCAVYCVCAVLTSGFQGEGVKGYFGFVKKQWHHPLPGPGGSDRRHHHRRPYLLGGNPGRKLQQAAFHQRW